ncbi:MAG: hypothetical protein NTY01_13170 [Verrucomicrobia bacterium]|nr:hypothetical protein [Verrucomicrobiota bacterium]
MREFHHIGVPSRQPRPNETYLKDGKVYVTPVDADPMGIEWLRFEFGSSMPKEIQTMTHLAFKVDDIEAELKGRKVLVPPFEPAPGIKVAFILHEGVPVEFMQLSAATGSAY